MNAYFWVVIVAGVGGGLTGLLCGKLGNWLDRRRWDRVYAEQDSIDELFGKGVDTNEP